MSFLSKLFGRGEAETAVLEGRECVHVSLAPGWDNADDMGVEAKASHFVCGTCGTRFTPAEAAVLRDTEKERVTL
jgi:hypothetical protein